MSAKKFSYDDLIELYNDIDLEKKQSIIQDLFTNLVKATINCQSCNYIENRILRLNTIPHNFGLV